jgi:hypothetical protein
MKKPAGSLLAKRLARIEAEAQARENERRRDEIDGALLAVFRNLWALYGYDHVPTMAEVDAALPAYAAAAGPVKLRELTDDELTALVLALKTWQARGWIPCEG